MSLFISKGKSSARQRSSSESPPWCLWDRLALIKRSESFLCQRLPDSRLFPRTSSWGSSGVFKQEVDTLCLYSWSLHEICLTQPNLFFKFFLRFWQLTRAFTLSSFITCTWFSISLLSSLPHPTKLTIRSWRFELCPQITGSIKPSAVGPHRGGFRGHLLWNNIAGKGKFYVDENFKINACINI